MDLLEEMLEHPGAKVRDANMAISAGRFKTVELSDHPKIVSINHKQFIRGLCDNLSNRMFTTASSKGSALQGQCEAQYANLVRLLQVLEPDNWPPAEKRLLRFGEEEVIELCERFRLPVSSSVIAFRAFKHSKGETIPDGLMPLLNCAKIILCSTAECERGFSQMNLIITPIRTKLLVERVSALMFLKLHGPSVDDWDPTNYVISWNRHHRLAEDPRTRALPETQKVIPDHCAKYL